MNLLRAIFGNRRSRTDDVDADRRKKNALQRHREIAASLDEAVKNLEATVQMSPQQAAAFRERVRSTMHIAHESPWSTFDFVSFSDICDYRKPAGKDGIASVCTHPGHEAAATGIASCSKTLCPRDPRKQ